MAARESLVYLMLSIFVVIFAKYVYILVIYINLFFSFLTLKLFPFFNYFFNRHYWGLVLSKMCILILLPLLLAGLAHFIYQFLRRKPMPYFFEITWGLWLIFVLSHILIH